MAKSNPSVKKSVKGPKKRHPYATETVEEATTRVRAMPTLVDLVGADVLDELAREYADYPEVLGHLPEYKLDPPEPQRKKRR